MTDRAPQAHFVAFLAEVGYHEAAWRLPSGEETEPAQHLIAAAKTAERGLLDAAFFADTPQVELFRAQHFPQIRYDPIDLCALLAGMTSKIGLVATASTTYGFPYDLARRLSTVDHFSGGRAGWNVVTTRIPSVALNFGLDAHPAHDDRYARAEEFVDVVRGLWDSWEDGAVLDDREAGRWADADRIHPLGHQGEHFSVAGALPVPRSPQGWPVLAQAGSSEAGVALAGRVADLVFTAQPDPAAGAAFRERMHASVARAGRSPDSVVVLPGLSFVLGSTEAEATERREQLESLVDPDFRWRNLAFNSSIPPDAIDPDQPLSAAVLPPEARTTRTEDMLRRTEQTGLSFRELAQQMTGLPGGLEFTGTPEQMADLIEQWMTGGASDGFTLQPATLPEALEVFVDHVVPILQRRGLHRTEYAGDTLRDHLGLPRPETAWAAARAS
jgi:FMN-dependent oxidoreductase (nitrilotriacetate monooxygenase family)